MANRESQTPIEIVTSQNPHARASGVANEVVVTRTGAAARVASFAIEFVTPFAPLVISSTSIQECQNP